MKILISLVALLSLISLCYGVSQPIIRGTKKNDCVDGRCGLLCAWDDVKIFPGQSLNKLGKCAIFTCNSNFDITITPCPFDMTGQTEYVDQDNSKLYPDCCGRKVPRNRN